MVEGAALSDTALLSGLIFGAALIYSAVGHAGASGYIAAMAIMGVAPTVMKPTALTLNILVASLATVRWHWAGLVNWRAMVPLLVASIPCAFVGGSMQIPAHWYRLLIGIVLLLAAAKLIFQPRNPTTPTESAARLPWPGAVISGSAVGFLSGLTGTGGGIFLSPILLFFGWANGPRPASGITAPFILLNSIAGLAGNYLTLQALPPELPWYMGSALLGAVLGTQVGIGWASSAFLQRLLGVVLVIAGLKFLFA
jgi:uncharacterized protein